MYIIVREVTNYTKEQLLLLRLLQHDETGGSSSSADVLPFARSDYSAGIVGVFRHVRTAQKACNFAALYSPKSTLKS